MARRHRRGGRQGGGDDHDRDDRRRRRRPEGGRDDHDKDDRRRRHGGAGNGGEAGMRTSTVTTAPADAAQAANADEDDLGAFFSSGHGPVMHYDRSDAEAGEAEAASGE